MGVKTLYEYFYKLAYGDKGTDKAALFNDCLDVADAEIKANKDHTIKTDNPHSVTKTQVSLDNVENLKVKLDGTSAPGVSNDNTEGYAIGSRWVDTTNDKEYVALDVSTGAAVWVETTSQGTTTLLGLTDTPAVYTDKAGRIVRVNSTPNAVEFANYNNVTVKTGACTLTTAEQGLILVSAAAPYTIGLPTAVGNLGLTYHFIKTDYNYNLITLDAYSTQTLSYPCDAGTPQLTYPRLNTGGAEVTIVSDNSNWIVLDEAIGQVPECRVDINATQENLVDGTFTLVNLDTEEYDIGSNFNTTTHLFTAPVAGKYIVSGNIGFTNTIANKRYFVTIFVNDGVKRQVGYHSGGDTGAMYGTISAILDVNKTDTISLKGAAFCGVDTVDILHSTTQVYTYLEIRLISKD